MGKFLTTPDTMVMLFLCENDVIRLGHALKLRLRRSMSKNQSARINLKFVMGKFLTTPDTMVMLFLCENNVIRPRPKVTPAALNVQKSKCSDQLEIWYG